MFEDLETAAKAMREQEERKESIFRQSVDAERNKEDLFDKKFAEALRKAKDAPDGKPLIEAITGCGEAIVMAVEKRKPSSTALANLLVRL